MIAVGATLYLKPLMNNLYANTNAYMLYTTVKVYTRYAKCRSVAIVTDFMRSTMQCNIVAVTSIQFDAVTNACLSSTQNWKD